MYRRDYAIYLTALLHVAILSADDSLDLTSYLLQSSRYNPALIPAGSQPINVKFGVALKTIINLVIYTLW